MHHQFENLLANHCAPVMFGIKPAALLAETTLPHDCPWVQMKARGFHRLRLCWRGNQNLTLIYNPELLSRALCHQTTRQALAQMGYPAHEDWKAQLRFLQRRFRESVEFPHEVGFFLGYPPDDVVGFIHCKYTCKNSCKLCGHWKVFGDTEQASAIFAEYARCKAALLRLLQEGGSIFTADLPALAG